MGGPVDAGLRVAGLAGVLVIVAATWSDEAPLPDWFGPVSGRS